MTAPEEESSHFLLGVMQARDMHINIRERIHEKEQITLTLSLIPIFNMHCTQALHNIGAFYK